MIVILKQQLYVYRLPSVNPVCIIDRYTGLILIMYMYILF